MFSELPKLFGREFAIGFLLPIAVFISASWLMLLGFESLHIHLAQDRLLARLGDQVLLGATIFAFVLWLGAVTLLALNRSIIQFKEGYGAWNPLRLLLFLQIRRFRKIHARIAELDQERETLSSLGQVMSSRKSEERRKLKRRAVYEFPHQERFVLPTAFGNSIRAFEVYSHVMYGFDAIPAWSRLEFLLSAEAQEIIESAKSQMDFWLNLWFLSLIFLGQYAALTSVTGDKGPIWSLAIIPLLFLFSGRSRVAAILWGEMVKATFDIYINDLRKKLEFPEKLTQQEETAYAVNLSRAMIFRNPSLLPKSLAELNNPEPEKEGGG